MPAGYFFESPWYVNPFENIAAIQFNHRILAVASLALILALWWRSRWAALGRGTRRTVNGLAVLALFQVVLGITTLLLVTPISLAVLHQATAVTLMTLALWFLLEVRPRRTQAA